MNHSCLSRPCEWRLHPDPLIAQRARRGWRLARRARQNALRRRMQKPPCLPSLAKRECCGLLQRCLYLRFHADTCPQLGALELDRGHVKIAADQREPERPLRIGRSRSQSDSSTSLLSSAHLLHCTLSAARARYLSQRSSLAFWDADVNEPASARSRSSIPSATRPPATSNSPLTHCVYRLALSMAGDRV